MEIIKFERIVSVNSELQGHGLQNILSGEISPNKNWMCEKGTEKAVAILQLQRTAVLTSVHIGNAHSAFVEVLVGKAADSSDQFESLIPMSVFMNPHESKTGTNPNRTRFFNKADFNESALTKSWDRIKVVCSQPFNKCVPYGLCFLTVHGEKETKKAELLPKDDTKDEIQIGSFFKKKRSSGGDKPLTVSEQIKEAEKEASLAKHTPISITKMSEKFSSEKKAKNEGESSKKNSEKMTKKKKEETAAEGKTPKRKKEEATAEEETPKRRKEETAAEEKTPKRKKEETAAEEKTPRRKKEKASVEINNKTDNEKKVEWGKDVKEKHKKKRPKRPFEKLMEGVVLVISGFVNPLRGDIRSMALEMGAKYSGDWDTKCTHLVCAYENTPKFRQVKGKGKIVKKDWVEKCHKDRKLYPWRRFALDKTDSVQAESEEEIDAEEESEPEEQVPGCSNVEMRNIKNNPEETASDVEDYNIATDDEEDTNVDTTDYPMPFLPDLLSTKRFYVDPSLESRSSLERYIVAYKGILTESFNIDVDFYVTEKGGAPVELFRKKVPNLVAVKPSWIWEINAKQKCVPARPHLV